MFLMGENKRLLFILLAVSGILLIAAIALLSRPKSSGHNSDISYSVETIDRGPVVSSIKASGVVESDDEIIIRSPERSILKKVYKNAGSKTTKGELLLELDEKSVRQEIDRIKNQLEQKRNSLEKIQLNGQNSRLSLDRSEEVKRMRINTLKSTLQVQEKMLADGNIDENRVERTRQEIELAETDLQTQVEKNAIRIQQMDADERGMLLQINSQQKTLQEKQALLNKLKIKAPADGVILAINSNEGQRIESDAMLLRMSDLSSFKVVGWVNEKYAHYIQTGNLVYVNLKDEKLEGVIGEITPMVDDEMIHFNVHLNDKRHSGLEINQSVSIEVISRQHEDVLRIKKQAYFEKSARQYLYVVDNKQAEKKEVILGTIGNKWCEVLSGLEEGDRVLTGQAVSVDSPDEIPFKKKYLK